MISMSMKMMKRLTTMKVIAVILIMVLVIMMFMGKVVLTIIDTLKTPPIIIWDCDL